MVGNTHFVTTISRIMSHFRGSLPLRCAKSSNATSRYSNTERMYRTLLESPTHWGRKTWKKRCLIVRASLIVRSVCGRLSQRYSLYCDIFIEIWNNATCATVRCPTSFPLHSLCLACLGPCSTPPGDGHYRRKRSWMLHTQVRCGPAELQHELHEHRTRS